MTGLHDVELREVTRRFGEIAAVDALDLAVQNARWRVLPAWPLVRQ